MMYSTIQNVSVKKYSEDDNGRLFYIPKRSEMNIRVIKYNPIRLDYYKMYLNKTKKRNKLQRWRILGKIFKRKFMRFL